MHLFSLLLWSCIICVRHAVENLRVKLFPLQDNVPNEIISRAVGQIKLEEALYEFTPIKK